MVKLNDKQKMFAIGGAALGVVLIAIGGAWWAKGLVDQERQAIEAKKAEIATAEGKIARIPPTEKQVIILRENLDEYVKILPEERALNAFVKQVTQWERQSGI